MEKFTPSMWLPIVSLARAQVDMYKTYRMGQAIYNLLPRDISTHAMNIPDHSKWYNSQDIDYCINYFIEHFTTTGEKLNG